MSENIDKLLDVAINGTRDELNTAISNAVGDILDDALTALKQANARDYLHLEKEVEHVVIRELVINTNCGINSIAEFEAFEKLSFLNQLRLAIAHTVLENDFVYTADMCLESFNITAHEVLSRLSAAINACYVDK